VPARIYRPEGTAGKLPLYIHLHGGGFHLGNLETEDASCRLLSLRTSTVVLNLNYRHAPEWTFPTPVNDVWDALNWVMRSAGEYSIDTNNVIIGGISAGASLACATALRELKTARPPKGR
jgi:acetyl esterase